MSAPARVRGHSTSGASTSSSFRFLCTIITTLAQNELTDVLPTSSGSLGPLTVAVMIIIITPRRATPQHPCNG